MKNKRISKDKIDSIFGSDNRDDEFYIELRETKDEVFAFLSFATIDEEIQVYIGKGPGAVIMELMCPHEVGPFPNEVSITSLPTS